MTFLTFVKLFIQLVFGLLGSVMVTTGLSMMNASSDMSVLGGVTLVFSAVVVLYYSAKFIWFSKITFRSNEKGS